MTVPTRGPADLRDEIAPLYAFVASRVDHDPAKAEDLTQETLLAAMQGGYRPELGPLRPWLIGIALRKIVDDQRRRRLTTRHLSDAARELADRMAREPLPDDLLERAESRAAVNEALAGLDPGDSALLIRRYFDGATVAELAADSGAGEKAVESRLTRARAALLKSLEELR